MINSQPLLLGENYPEIKASQLKLLSLIAAPRKNCTEIKIVGQFPDQTLS